MLSGTTLPPPARPPQVTQDAVRRTEPPTLLLSGEGVTPPDATHEMWNGYAEKCGAALAFFAER
jgi:hypothetical protein